MKVELELEQDPSSQRLEHFKTHEGRMFISHGHRGCRSSEPFSSFKMQTAPLKLKSRNSPNVSGRMSLYKARSRSQEIMCKKTILQSELLCAWNAMDHASGTILAFAAIPEQRPWPVSAVGRTRGLLKDA